MNDPMRTHYCNHHLEDSFTDFTSKNGAFSTREPQATSWRYFEDMNALKTKALPYHIMFCYDKVELLTTGTGVVKNDRIILFCN